jgi:pimeloyl-ACP methyl ester carboxylesterase
MLGPVTRHAAIGEFEPALDGGALEDLRERLDRWRGAASAAEGWSRGVPGRWLAQLLADWRSFDTAAFQARLDRLDHSLVELGGQRIHFVSAPGRGDHSLPLLLTHGWPGSVCEYLAVLDLLSDPVASGGDAADSFTVVAPSLPGFAFSSPPPPEGLSASAIAELWNRLMTEVLGHHRYAAHGSDLGAGVTARLARAHPESVIGIHLATPGLPAPPRPWSAEEERHFAEVDAWVAEEGAYAHMQATKPATLSAALEDSPVGFAAWIGEKVSAWSSMTSEGEPAFGRELLLSTLTLYWATGTIASSMLPYWTYRHDPGSGLPADDPATVPTSVSIFGGERVPFPKPPRELAERYFTIHAWSEHDRGGHFPAVADPALFAQTLRDAFRPLRGANDSREGGGR